MAIAQTNFAPKGKLGPEEIQIRFGFHTVTVEGDAETLEKLSDLRFTFREFAEYLDEVLPNGRAKSAAFTELENASMWSQKAIAEEAPLTEENNKEKN